MAGGALLVLFLVGAGTLGATGASPARAAEPGSATCTPATMTEKVEQWGGIPGDGGLTFKADVTTDDLLTALGSAPIADAAATVAVTDSVSGAPVFSGDVTYSFDPSTDVLSISGDQLSDLAGENSDWPFDQATTLALTFTLPGANDWPITVTVTGPAMGSF